MTQDENDLTFRKNKVDMLCKNSQIEQDYQVPVCATLSVSPSCSVPVFRAPWPLRAAVAPV